MADTRMPEILAFRDGAPTDKETRRLIANNREALESLIDARILALALAPQQTSEKSGRPIPPVHELLEYLTSPMSDGARADMELAVRGNPRALAALIDLRKTLTTEPGPTTALPAPTPRIDLGEVRFRIESHGVVFRDPTAVNEGLASLFEDSSIADRPPLAASYERLAPAADFGSDHGLDLEVALSHAADVIAHARTLLTGAGKTGARGAIDAKGLFQLARDLRDLSERISAAAKAPQRFDVMAEYRLPPRPPRPRYVPSLSFAAPGAETTLTLSGAGSNGVGVYVEGRQAGMPLAQPFDVTVLTPGIEFSSLVSSPNSPCHFVPPRRTVTVLCDGLLPETLAFRLRPDL